MWLPNVSLFLFAPILSVARAFLVSEPSGGMNETLRCRMVKVNVLRPEENNMTAVPRHCDVEYHCILRGDNTTENATTGVVDGLAYKLVGLDMAFVQENRDVIRGGVVELGIEGAMISTSRTEGHSIHLTVANVTMITDEDIFSDRRGRRLQGPQSAGDRTVLVLRVSAPDQKPDATANVISSRIFGGDGVARSFSLAAQMAACSFRQLTFRKARGRNIDDGVVDVEINMNITGSSASAIQNAATSAATTILGYSPFTRFDHVMYCLPGGPDMSGAWLAYAHHRGSVSVYRGPWCAFPSAQMHEVGLNLGLDVSSSGTDDLGDGSGTMGRAEPIPTGPARCFNGVKSWELGWYADRHKSVDPLDVLNGVPWMGKLVGPAEYDKTDANHTVVLQIVSSNPASTLYVMYNRRKGINAETRANGDMVTILRSEPGESTSQFLGGVGPSGSYTHKSFTGDGTNSCDLVVAVTDVVFGDPDYAEVNVTCPFPPTPSSAPTEGNPYDPPPPDSPISWDIVKTGLAEVKFMDDSIETEIVVSYNISNLDTSVTVYESDCETEVMASVINSSKTFSPTSSSHGNLTVMLDIKQDAVTDSTIWSSEPPDDDLASIDICVRVDLLLPPSMGSINFHGTKLSLTIDTSQQFNVTQITSDRKAVINFADESVVDYRVNSCQCSPPRTCVNQTLDQTSELYICLWTNSENMELYSIRDLELTQNDFTFSAIDNGVENALTSAVCDGKACVIRTRLLSSFFESNNPPQVVAGGVVVLAFSDDDGNADGRRARKHSWRRLEAYDDQAAFGRKHSRRRRRFQADDGADEAAFTVTVDLEVEAPMSGGGVVGSVHRVLPPFVALCVAMLLVDI